MIYSNSNSDSGDEANNIQFPYIPEIEIQMVIFHQLLSEKDKRLYAADEALKLGFGGISYISKVLNGCN